MKHISRLHFITNSSDKAFQACNGGVDWVQLRMKHVADDVFRAEAVKTKEICKHYKAVFLINDNVQLAVELEADGVHLGKSDMSPVAAREMLGPDRIIGCTANTLEDVLHLSRMPIDYIGLGPFRFTTTKENLSPVLGVEGYKSIIESLKRDKVRFPPVVGIGGVGFQDIVPLMQTGMHGIAVSGAIANSDHVALEAKVFKRVVDEVANPPGIGSVVAEKLMGLTDLSEIIAVLDGIF